MNYLTLTRFTQHVTGLFLACSVTLSSFKCAGSNSLSDNALCLILKRDTAAASFIL